MTDNAVALTLQRSAVADTKLLSAGAAALAEAIRTGAVSAAGAVEAHIARIEEVDPLLNAVVVRRFGAARAEAAAADAARQDGAASGPLLGVPITIKEQFLVKGTPTTFGLQRRRDHCAEWEGPLVTALRRAGAIVVGKTNVCQTLIYHESDNPLYGRTVNPWDALRTPGGSSGGEAAVVAAGGSAAGLGSDLGGSIRVPAHFCGIHGLKPTLGRLPGDDTPRDYGSPPLDMAAQPGPMTRRVADLWLLMSVLAAAAPAVPPATMRGEPTPFQARVTPAAQLRVGFYTDDGFFPAAPALRRAVQEAAAALSAAGAHVKEFAFPRVDEGMRLFLLFNTADNLQRIRAALGPERPVRPIAGLLRLSRVPNALREPLARAIDVAGQRRFAFPAHAARHLTATGLEQARADLIAYRALVAAAMDAAGVDVLLSPPHALPALPHGATEFLHVANAGSYSVIYNALGYPAGVAAATRVRPGEESDRPPSRDWIEQRAARAERGSAGLPIGVQVAARAWREDLVLSAMGILEEHFSAQDDYPSLAR